MSLKYENIVGADVTGFALRPPHTNVAVTQFPGFSGTFSGENMNKIIFATGLFPQVGMWAIIAVAFWFVWTLDWTYDET